MPNGTGVSLYTPHRCKLDFSLRAVAAKQGSLCAGVNTPARKRKSGENPALTRNRVCAKCVVA